MFTIHVLHCFKCIILSYTYVCQQEFPRLCAESLARHIYAYCISLPQNVTYQLSKHTPKHIQTFVKQYVSVYTTTSVLCSCVPCCPMVGACFYMTYICMRTVQHTMVTRIIVFIHMFFCFGTNIRNSCRELCAYWVCACGWVRMECVPDYCVASTPPTPQLTQSDVHICNYISADERCNSCEPILVLSCWSFSEVNCRVNELPCNILYQ